MPQMRKWPDYFSDFCLSIKQIPENISRRNVHMKVIKNFPLNIVSTHAKFQSCFQQLFRSEGHFLERPLGMNGTCLLFSGVILCHL